MKIFFASDVHIGVYDDPSKALILENNFLNWLEFVKNEGQALYLLGDIFDFWFEYKEVIPKGYSAVLAKLRELSQAGIDVHFFHGNHDEWTRDYLSSYCGITIHRNEPEVLELQGRKIVAGHGHKLGMDRRLHVRFMHAAFNSPLLFWLSSTIVHPNLFILMGTTWSRGNKLKKRHQESNVFQPQDNRLVKYVESPEWREIDYFMFGHFHSPVDFRLKNETKDQRLIILGDWIQNPYYAVMENGVITLEKLQVASY